MCVCVCVCVCVLLGCFGQLLRWSEGIILYLFIGVSCPLAGKTPTHTLTLIHTIFSVPLSIFFLSVNSRQDNMSFTTLVFLLCSSEQLSSADQVEDHKAFVVHMRRIVFMLIKVPFFSLFDILWQIQ